MEIQSIWLDKTNLAYGWALCNLIHVGVLLYSMREQKWVR